jgi:putative tryptophan/tyrosine transport system substrate-binding protein
MKALVLKGYDQSNVEVITQTPNPDPISWANSIRKFNAIGADLIVSYGASATIAAMRESNDIPVVFADVYGPVESGIAKSMASTGRNMAGISSKVPLVTLVRTAMALKPIRSLGVIYTAREEGSQVQLREAHRIAVQSGFRLNQVNVNTTGALDGALATLFAAHVDCIYITESTAGSRGFEKIVHRASELKIPVISQMPGAAHRGAVISLEADPAEQGQVAADYAARMLAGRRGSQLPVATPKRVDLIVNLKVARALELHVPFPVLSVATRVLK